jgi:hypothetical protein
VWRNLELLKRKGGVMLRALSSLCWCPAQRLNTSNSCQRLAPVSKQAHCSTSGPYFWEIKVRRECEVAETRSDMALPSWDMHLQHLRLAKGTQANSNETELSLRYISVAQSYADNSPLCPCSTKYPGEREAHGQGGFNYCSRILPPHATGLHTGSRHLMMTLKYHAPYMLT